MNKKNFSRIVVNDTAKVFGKDKNKVTFPSNRFGYSQLIHDEKYGGILARLSMDFDFYQKAYYCEIDQYEEIEPLNPYKDEFFASGKRLMSIVRGGITISETSDFNARGDLCRKYSWSVPSEDFAIAIQNLTNKKLVDIGAGTGYWAWFLKQYGINTICYDIAPYKNHHADNQWVIVNNGGPEKAKDHQDRTLALFWPMLDDPQAYDALKAYTGDTVVYVGEQSYGCTGDEAFHEELESNWNLIHHEYCKYQWDGIHSQETIWKRI